MHPGRHLRSRQRCTLRHHVRDTDVYLLAYNVIRRMMLQAARMGDALPRQLSFTQTLQLCMACRNFRPRPAPDAEQEYRHLIAQRRVGKRPGRIEPRAVKRRPKPFPLLTKR